MVPDLTPRTLRQSHLQLSLAETGNSGKQIEVTKDLLNPFQQMPQETLIITYCSEAGSSLFRAKQLMSEYLALEEPISFCSLSPGVETFEAVLVKSCIRILKFGLLIYFLIGVRGCW